MGILVSWEGLSCIGKTTTLNRVREILDGLPNIRVYHLKDDGSFSRANLSSVGIDPEQGIVREMLYATQTLSRMLELEKLKKHYDIVFVDRYVDSMLAYGRAYNGFLSPYYRMFKAIYDEMERVVPSPDLTFYCKVDRETWAERIKQRYGEVVPLIWDSADTIEKEYKYLFDKRGVNVLNVNLSKSPNDLAIYALRYLNTGFNLGLDIESSLVFCKEAQDG